jgi:hypothetical protein
MSNSSYKYISDFGSNKSPLNNPLTYCVGDNLDQRLTHGGISDSYGSYSRPCQLFMADYCASEWDSFCELESRNKNKSFPSRIDGNCNTKWGKGECNEKAGDALIANTASRKYLIKMHNGEEKYEPFDPTVADSPMIRYWIPDSCRGNIKPEYGVDPNIIDNDTVMDKILENPDIAFSILENIFNSMKIRDTLKHLKDTKLGHFYRNHPYFISLGSLIFI